MGFFHYILLTYSLCVFTSVLVCYIPCHQDFIIIIFNKCHKFVSFSLRCSLNFLPLCFFQIFSSASVGYTNFLPLCFFQIFSSASVGYTNFLPLCFFQIFSSASVGYTNFLPLGTETKGDTLENQQINIGLLTHCGRVTEISVFNTVKLGTSASSP